jgi:hypothetical protein
MTALTAALAALLLAALIIPAVVVQNQILTKL